MSLGYLRCPRICDWYAPTTTRTSLVCETSLARLLLLLVGQECRRLLRTASIPIGCCNRGRLHLWENQKQMRLEKIFNRW